ncbi:hypothetical protein GCM10027169_17060 [Gordonia jinhuaensis]|uniref:Uncharacterized protein n=1 Tax=Gordonia jinhuaensis TaxID=1517702 RepID=A0A916X0L8_9ACTN|nr:hypothetical protein [Gordonia jinhuaensis]GGB47646.1 hypothetical protein GCM10011489_38590 [Gordonia jinhuaensis]
MTNDLVVEENTTLTVSDEPSPEIEPYVQRINIQTVGDLAVSGLIRESSLDTVLAAGKKVTSQALQRVSITRPTQFVTGTKKLDLGRFTAFLIDTPAVNPIERQIFWNAFRGLDPNLKIDRTVKVKIPSYINLLLADCTIKPGGVLKFVGKGKATHVRQPSDSPHRAHRRTVGIANCCSFHPRRTVEERQ